MKTRFTLILILYSYFIFGQISLISVNGNNVYLGIENKLEVNSNSNLIFSTSNGKVEKKGNEYFYIPDQLGFASIQIINNEKENIQLTFRVIEIPKPQAIFLTNDLLPRKNNKYIDRKHYSKERIKEFYLIATFLPDFNFEVRITIDSYELQYLGKNNSIQTLIVNNNKFYSNEEIKKIVDNCSPGDIFMISKILTKNNINNNLKYIDSIYFIVADN